MLNTTNSLSRPSWFAPPTQLSRELFLLGGASSIIASLYSRIFDPRKKDQQKNWEEPLQIWINNAPEEERTAREIAARRIRECYAIGSDKLDLSRLDITSLDGLLLPSHLKKLFLCHTRITSLVQINLPQNLEALDLTFSPISSLAGVMLPQSLKKLRLYHTNICSLTGVIFPRNLEDLDLSENNISSLIGVIFPQSLSLLNLTGTNIRFLPESLAQLPRSANILTEACDLNEAAIATFRSAILRARNQDSSRGPQWIPYDFLIIETFCDKIGMQNYPNLTRHEDFRILSAFVNRLSEIEDYQNMSTQSYVIETVREILEFADKNEVFRNILFTEVQAGTSDCSDRPTYCFSRIIAQMAPSKAEERGEGAVCEALFNLERIKAIEEYAQELSAGESIEAALWLRLQVLPDPNGVQSMSNNVYATGALNLGQKHIEEANRRILAVTDSKDKRIAIVAKSAYFQKRCERLSEYIDICDISADEVTAVMNRYSGKEFSSEAKEEISKIEKALEKKVAELIHREATSFVEHSQAVL